jgi:hypothetical protein
LNVIMLNVIMLNAIMLNVIKLIVIMLYVIMLNAIMLNVIILNVIMLIAIMLNVIMLNVIMLNVVMLNVVTLFISNCKLLVVKKVLRHPPFFISLCFLLSRSTSRNRETKMFVLHIKRGNQPTGTFSLLPPPPLFPTR